MDLKACVKNVTRDTLFEQLTNPKHPPASVQEAFCSGYLVDYLKDINASTMVVEEKYTDGDYLEDYVTYYAKCHADYDRHCKRLHFFAGKFDGNEFDGYIRGSLSSERDAEIHKSYLGFVVVRPLPGPVVGRTVLAHYEDHKAGGVRAYRCTRTYHANLFGKQLKDIESLAFQEQDKAVAACATVALWSAFQKTSVTFQTTAPRPAQITRAATATVKKTRSIPSSGLIVEQMCSAISEIGLEPEVVDIVGRGNIPLPSLLYGHLKGGLPVLLGVKIEEIGLHAVALAGYDVMDKAVLGKEVYGNNKCLPMIGLRIEKFYAHDDQIGPFARMYVQPGTKVNDFEFPVEFKGAWLDKDKVTPLRMLPIVAVVPVYNKIRVKFLDVHDLALELHIVLETLFLKGSSIEWDIFLSTTNDFKTDLRTQLSTQPDLRMDLLTSQLPRFMWRAILRVNGSTCLELIADATDTPTAVPFQWAVWHNVGFRTQFRDYLKKAPAGLRQILLKIMSRRFLEFIESTLIP